MEKDVIIKNSKIEGKGVFAARDFKKGEIVLKWNISKILTSEQVKSLPEEKKKYIIFFNGKYILMQPPERYVNHSCDANTYVHNFCDIAKREIKKEEEITADYSESGTPDLEMKCKCGSKNCRRVIRSSS